MWKLEAEYLDTEKIDEIIGALSEFGIKFLNLTGGEPTLHPGLEKIVKSIRAHGIYLNINTNGYNERVVDYAKKYDFSISVSFDNHDEEKMNEWRGYNNAYDRAIKTITKARDLGIVVDAMVLPTDYNFPLEDTIKFITKELKVPSSIAIPSNVSKGNWSYNSEYKFNYDSKEMLRLYNKYPIITFPDVLKDKKVPCYGGYYTFYIDWKADIYPCFNKEKIANYKDLKEIKLNKKACFDCKIACFTTPSLLYSNPLKLISKAGLRSVKMVFFN